MYSSTEFKNLELLIVNGEIQTYHKKYIAQKYAKKNGFNKNDIILIKRVLDKQWIIAKDYKDHIECAVIDGFRSDAIRLNKIT